MASTVSSPIGDPDDPDEIPSSPLSTLAKRTPLLSDQEVLAQRIQLRQAGARGFMDAKDGDPVSGGVSHLQSISPLKSHQVPRISEPERQTLVESLRKANAQGFMAFISPPPEPEASACSSSEGPSGEKEPFFLSEPVSPGRIAIFSSIMENEPVSFGLTASSSSESDSFSEGADRPVRQSHLPPLETASLPRSRSTSEITQADSHSRGSMLGRFEGPQPSKSPKDPRGVFRKQGHPPFDFRSFSSGLKPPPAATAFLDPLVRLPNCGILLDAMAEQARSTELYAGFVVIADRRGHLEGIVRELFRADLRQFRDELLLMREETHLTRIISAFLHVFAAPALPVIFKGFLVRAKKSSFLKPEHQVQLFERLCRALFQFDTCLPVPVLRVVYTLSHTLSLEWRINTLEAFQRIVCSLLFLRFICPFLIFQSLDLTRCRAEERCGYLTIIKMVQCLAGNTELDTNTPNCQFLNSVISGKRDAFREAVFALHRAHDSSRLVSHLCSRLAWPSGHLGNLFDSSAVSNQTCGKFVKRWLTFLLPLTLIEPLMDLCPQLFLHICEVAPAIEELSKSKPLTIYLRVSQSPDSAESTSSPSTISSTTPSPTLNQIPASPGPKLIT